MIAAVCSGSLLLAGREVWTLLPIAGLLMRRIGQLGTTIDPLLT